MGGLLRSRLCRYIVYEGGLMICRQCIGKCGGIDETQAV